LFYVCPASTYIDRFLSVSVNGGFQNVKSGFPKFLAFAAAPDYHNHEYIIGGMVRVSAIFAETLKRLRTEKGLSQKQLGKQMFVNHSTIARWESGSRLPDAAMMLRLAGCLGVDVNALLQIAAQSDESPNVIMVDDSSVILSDGLAVLEEVMPNATITGFIWPQEAIEYAKINRIALAVLDIELGTASGIELCRRLQEINPRTNIVFLTAFADYSLEAWKTEASGFMLKPLTPESVKEQLKKLRYPFAGRGAEE
jgi:Response regulator containing CheY-like receiver and SARP domains